MKHVTLLVSSLALSLGAAMAPAHAQMSGMQGAGNQSSDAIEARYQAAKDRCNAMSGNQHDVCMKQADADRTAAKANAKADSKAAEANHDAQKDKRDAQYKVAKEKCDAMSGDAKDKCMANAKTQFGK